MKEQTLVSEGPDHMFSVVQCHSAETKFLITVVRDQVLQPSPSLLLSQTLLIELTFNK